MWIICDTVDSNTSSAFLGTPTLSQLGQQQPQNTYYSPQVNYPTTQNKNIPIQHSTTPPLQQMATQMGHPQYPPNIYPQQHPTTTQHFIPNQGFQQHPSFYGGGGFLPSYQSASTSLNSSFSTDYSETNDKEFEKVIEYIANLKYPEKREEALQELSKKRESFPKLAVYLWHSVGTLAIL